MNRRVVVLATLLLTAGIALAQIGGYTPPRPKDQPRTTRELVGQVMSKSEAPLAQAVVHLKNTRTLTEKTYIADKEGNYRFAALAVNADYEVFAEHDGKRSDVKTLSAFDSRAKATINLKIDSAKK